MTRKFQVESDEDSVFYLKSSSIVSIPMFGKIGVKARGQGRDILPRGSGRVIHIFEHWHNLLPLERKIV